MSVQFKKRNTQTKNLRPKGNEGGDDDEETEAKVKRAVLSTSTKNTVSTGLPKREAAEDQSSSAVVTVFESSKEVMPQSYAGDATHTTEIDTSTDRDARAILERNIRLNIADQEGEATGGAPVYRGLGGYKSFVSKDLSQAGANKFTGTQGPIRAPSFVRSSCRFDYQPDICKDYKETGFCGYGDQCKFLHDRGDYKSGWQLEREWDSQQAKKKKRLEDAANAALAADGTEVAAAAGGAGEEEENFEVDLDDALPFACHICRGSFVNPVVTLCQHYFCGDCILGATKKSNRCLVCDKQTFGVFNRAHKLQKRLQQQQQQELLAKSVSTTKVKSAWTDISLEDRQ